MSWFLISYASTKKGPVRPHQNCYKENLVTQWVNLESEAVEVTEILSSHRSFGRMAFYLKWLNIPVDFGRQNSNVDVVL
ncbi:hypothetical protein FQR65_LT05839 [Abscondita terminalis]|nr:hypothetical protein FQR65_LT05839 [Abscondita terminalis]